MKQNSSIAKLVSLNCVIFWRCTLSKKGPLIPWFASPACRCWFFPWPPAFPIASESLRHLVDKAAVPERPSSILAAPQCGSLPFLLVQNLSPVCAPALTPPPFHIQDSGLVHPGQVCRGAGPAVVRRASHHSSAQPIALHIRHCRPEMIPLQQAGEEAILPEKYQGRTRPDSVRELAAIPYWSKTCLPKSLSEIAFFRAAECEPGVRVLDHWQQQRRYHASDQPHDERDGVVRLRFTEAVEHGRLGAVESDVRL